MYIDGDSAAFTASLRKALRQQRVPLRIVAVRLQSQFVLGYIIMDSSRKPRRDGVIEDYRRSYSVVAVIEDARTGSISWEDSANASELPKAATLLAINLRDFLREASFRSTHTF